MNKLKVVSVVVLFAAVLACGGGDGGAGGAGGGTASSGAGGGTGSGALEQDAGEDPIVMPNCAGFCQKSAMASCGDVTATCQADCSTVVNSSPACSDIQARFFNCVADLNQAQIQCDQGVTVAPSCEPVGELVGVNGCAAAVNNTNCYGATCKFDSDCGDLGTFSCNTKTKRCIRQGTSCRGLPCKFDSDCGNLGAWICSSALRVCVAK